MKRIFTLSLMFAAVLTVCAQTWQKLPGKTFNAQQTANRAIAVGDNQAWWGYVGADDELTLLGTGNAETYHCAIFIPGNHVIAGGKTICGVRFGMPAKNVKDIKVWLAASRPASITATTTLQMVDVATTDLEQNIAEVALPTAYEIPATGVWVGYTFTITSVATQGDAYPIMVGGSDTPNGMWLRTSSSVTAWSNMNGQGYGSLFLQALLEGQFADNQATPADFGSYYAKVGESAEASFALTNLGTTPVSSIDYTIAYDGEAGAEQHADLTQPIAFCSTGNVGITLAADAAQSRKEGTLTVTKVNGNANEAASNSAKFTLFSLSEIIDRNVVVEQFTGTGCGWCPRGHVGMAKMQEQFGDRFVGIALHQYSNQSRDAMYIAKTKYAPLSFGGAPSARIDRGAEVDPYYGSGSDVRTDFAAEMAIPAMAKVEASGLIDEDITKVKASVDITPLFDGKYSVEFVVIGNEITGTANSFKQANYYSSSYASQTGLTKASLPSDLVDLWDKGSTFTATFNDVALASSYESRINQVDDQELTANQTKTVSYVIDMPTYKTLHDALSTDHIYVAAIVLDEQGNVVNADKAKVTIASLEDIEHDDTDGIQTVATSTAARETARYAADGRLLTAPQRGLNIVRMSDGTTRKVMVK